MKTLWRRRSSALFAALVVAIVSATAVSVAVAAPLLTHGGATVSDPPPGGDDDGALEPGETARITERLKNAGTDPVTGLAGTLSSSTAGVTLPQPAATWPTLGATATESGTPPFQVALANSVSCGATMDFSLALTSDQGAPEAVPFKIPVGVGPATASSDPGLPREIGTAAGFDSTLELSGSGTVRNLRVHIPKITHSWVGDIVMTLRSPAGTTVTLLKNRGSSGNDFVDLVFADDAATSIATIPGSAPAQGHTGAYRPEGNLSAFDGEDRAGTWTLHVSDTHPSDSGLLHGWGVAPVGRSCSTPGSDAPYAVPNGYTVTAGTTLDGASVLANDSGDGLTAVKESDPAHGALALAANGSFTYTPTAGYTGSDSFTYRASNGSQTSDPTTVSITVKAPNYAPVANANAYSVVTGRMLSGSSVLANDSDANGDSLTAVKDSDPMHGTLTLNANGTFTYVPEAGYVGSDSFTYHASDGTLSSAPATVTITVRANTPPVATADAYSIPGNQTLSRDVLSNDSDADNHTLTAVRVGGPENGVLTLASNGSFTYKANAGFTGEDTFQYKAHDGIDASPTVTVSITVQAAVNRAPSSASDSYTIAENGSLEVGSVLSNDVDPDGDALTAIKETNTAHGALSFRPDGGFTYTPDRGYAGLDTFTYRASDGTATSALTTVSITMYDVASPVANPDYYSAPQGGSVSGWLTDNDSLPAGSSITAEVVNSPRVGTLQLSPNGWFTYTAPSAPQPEPVLASYRIGVGSDWSAPAPITFDVYTSGPPLPPFSGFPFPFPYSPSGPGRSTKRPKASPPAFANFRVEHAALRGGKLAVRAGISQLATGNVKAYFRSGGRTTKLDATIASGVVRFDMALSTAQRRSKTGLLTLAYSGNAGIRAETVKVKAARRSAAVSTKRALIDGKGVLRVAGTISRSARGIVRVRLTYSPRVGLTKVFDYKAKIRAGKWSVSDPLPTEAPKARGQVVVGFEGDTARGLGGAHISHEVGA